MQRSAIIVAGGSGTRIGGVLPKQFQDLLGRPMLCWTLEAFAAFDPDLDLVLVLPAVHRTTWEELRRRHGFHLPHRVTDGGHDRTASVRNGLALVDHDGVVGVHDGARPLASPALIERCFTTAKELGNAVPVVPVTSSLREVTLEGNQAADRTRYRLVQTPQCFRAHLLREAFEQAGDASYTDEAGLVESAGNPIHLVDGEAHNLKVTEPLDLRVAALLLGGRV